MNQSLLISISNDLSIISDLPSPWVALEQELPSPLSQFASIRDIYKLWMAAVSGKSSQTLRAINCPVEFHGSDVYVYLGFYAWPSVPALNYTLTAAQGIIGTRQIMRKPREFSVFIDNSNRCDLPYYMEELVCVWETPTFDQYGDSIPTPNIINHNTWLEFSTEVFGVLRITGKAIGVYCIVEMIVSKPMAEEPISPEEITAQRERDESAGLFLSYVPPTTRLNGQRISNFENTITASWQNIDGKIETDELKLEMPQCVKDILNFCPDMFKTILLWCDTISTRQVYYGTCEDDDLLAVIDGIDERSYCSRTEVGDNFNPRDLT